ncbi:hypothetical protein [Pseudocnuella soli]|uniref:hypothetical protein n=1 Tax=Pseudocnuella soli TaxID=2502779 RepID=UPI001043A3DC|nr:hypothetical protein [Pseudocnuella soli]
MRKHDFGRIIFHSKGDLVNGIYLSKIEEILKKELQPTYLDINDILELYNVKQYFDQKIYLKSWTDEDISFFSKRIAGYGKIIGVFIATINDENLVESYKNILQGYLNSFWELINNQQAYKRISKETFNDLLLNEPHLIDVILNHRSLVDYYKKEIRAFLLSYSKSAEILLSNYEVQDNNRRVEKYFPSNLSIADKEHIISTYLDYEDANYNFIKLIKDLGKREDFRITDKTRLKAKRLYKSKTEKFFATNEGIRYGVEVSFRSETNNIKEAYFDDDRVLHCIYSLDFIEKNNDPFLLFCYFKYLFEYLDEQNRINLLSKKSDTGVIERFMGLRSRKEYWKTTAFSLAEMTSYVQIHGYNTALDNLNISVEKILHHVFTIAFKERYHFAENARITLATTNSYFERIRILAPELESVLKQFKLFVEDGEIDFELMQMSSSPTTIEDIPSLNENKYVYFNEGNKEAMSCCNLFFSDQTLLAYVDRYKESLYQSFFDLLANEEVSFDSYDEHQIPEVNYLIEKGFITINDNRLIEITNYQRLLILKDLYENEFASLFHYPLTFQQEVQRMAKENIITYGNTLFSKPEQEYFTYFLNRSKFTNGLDLRNKYLHGTQANPDEIHKHEYAYFTYLKLMVLAILKMDDDLLIWSKLENEKREYSSA